MVMQGNSEWRPSSDPQRSLSSLEQQGRLLNGDSEEYFSVGYTSVDAVFDPQLDVYGNVLAALRATAARGDQYAPNQGGFVLGVLARVTELGDMHE